MQKIHWRACAPKSANQAAPLLWFVRHLVGYRIARKITHPLVRTSKSLFLDNGESVNAYIHTSRERSRTRYCHSHYVNGCVCLLVTTYFQSHRFGCVYPPPLTRLEPHSRFGEKPLKLQVVCPLNGTAVLKGLRHALKKTGAENRPRVCVIFIIVYYALPRHASSRCTTAEYASVYTPRIEYLPVDSLDSHLPLRDVQDLCSTSSTQKLYVF